MKHGLIIVALLAWVVGSGCTSRHAEGIGKDVTILELYPSGTYWLRNTGVVARYNEKGRWWSIEDNVAVLVPDDPTFHERFVNTTESGLFDDLEIYDTLREALANQQLDEPTRKTLIDDWFAPKNQQGSSGWSENSFWQIEPERTNNLIHYGSTRYTHQAKYPHGKLGTAPPPPGVERQDLSSSNLP